MYIEGTTPTLERIKEYMENISTGDLLEAIKIQTDFIKTAREDGNADLLYPLSLWRALLLEALQKKSRFAYHRWMSRVIDSNGIDPTPFFLPAQGVESGARDEHAPYFPPDSTRKG